MKHEYCAELDDILIRPLHRYDIDYLRQWRNCNDINRFLRNISPVSEESQSNWYKEYLTDEDKYFFAIDYMRKRTVGSLALYGFEKNSCQIGKLMIGEKDARGHHVAEKAFLMVMGIANIYMGIDKFCLAVHENNTPAQKVYKNLGFYKIGSHPFEKGGTEDEMMIKAMKLKKCELANWIMFYEENGMIARNWEV